MRRVASPRLAALTLLLGAVACGNRAEAGAGADTPVPPGGAEARAQGADSVRGTVAVVGADPATTVVVRTAAGPVTVRGAVADTLRALRGVVVRVSGERADDGSLSASGFRVRSVDGIPAADGVLEIRGDAAVLVGPDGERGRYAPVPIPLRHLAGRRVWIAGMPGETPESWGLIEPLR